MDDIYHNCRWCRYNNKGKCVKSSSVFASVSEDEAITLTEGGYLSEALQEGLTFPKMLKLEILLQDYGISQKRQKEILNTVRAELEDSIPVIVEGLDSSVSKLLYKQDKADEDLELKDPESFYCKFFE